jgi:hypothetical protein
MSTQQFEHDGFNSPNEVEMANKASLDSLARHEEPYRAELQRIGGAIGYGNAQSILGELWDQMLHREYGVADSSRGRMGVTVDDALPPIPRSQHKRRRQSAHGGYEMVPAYTVDEMKAFAHAAIAKATGSAA